MLSRTKLKRLRSLVPDEVAIAHLDEAISCYKAGAYRMCTVMMANAVFGKPVRAGKPRKLDNRKSQRVSNIYAVQLLFPPPYRNLVGETEIGSIPIEEDSGFRVSTPWSMQLGVAAASRKVVPPVCFKISLEIVILFATVIGFQELPNITHCSLHGE